MQTTSENFLLLFQRNDVFHHHYSFFFFKLFYVPSVTVNKGSYTVLKKARISDIVIANPAKPLEFTQWDYRKDPKVIPEEKKKNQPPLPD